MHIIAKMMEFHHNRQIHDADFALTDLTKICQTVNSAKLILL